MKKLNLVFFLHPPFLGSQSMPRFARMLAEGMIERGHHVKLWAPKPRFFRLPAPDKIKKWLGYIDQYIVFPLEVKNCLIKCSADTLFVFTDHALGPWVPLVSDRPHAIHCHDFLAQRSALGEIPENPTNWSGKRYQQFIRQGYSKGKYFIAISGKTKEDLRRLLFTKPLLTEVVYNGMNQKFLPKNIIQSRELMGNKTGLDLSQGYILHVGGNQWYKNRIGVIEIYNCWRAAKQQRLPLLMIGPKPNTLLLQTYKASPFKSDIHLLSNIDDELIHFAYSGATVLLFPSLAEGFGWPITEAMASGCPVITTGEAPMTEAGGNAAFYIPRMPIEKTALLSWAMHAADVLHKVINLSSSERNVAVNAGLSNAARFETTAALEHIESIYYKILYPGSDAAIFPDALKRRSSDQFQPAQ